MACFHTKLSFREINFVKKPKETGKGKEKFVFLVEKMLLIYFQGKGEILTYWLVGQDPSYRIEKVKPPKQKLPDLTEDQT